MKIAYCSDLHLEFGDLTLENTENAEVLVLAGDIMVAGDLKEYIPNKLEGFQEFRSERFHNFMQDVCGKFNRVIYIMGNHEHYYGDYANTLKHLKDCFAYLENLTIVDRELVKIGDVNFICGTMWTDMNNDDDMTLRHVRDMMNDFRCVEDSRTMVQYKVFLPDPHNPGKDVVRFKERVGKFTPQEASREFRMFKEYVALCTACLGKNDQKYVVVTHHAPSFLSVAKQYRSESLMNGAYASDMDEFIKDHPGIKFWIHGHMHNVINYVIGDTNVLANPRGYKGHEQSADDFKLKYFEV